jgi:hypothetical protein
MKTIFKLFPVILLLAAIAQFAIPMLGLNQTVAGMRAAVNGQPGTFVYSKPGIDYVLLGWSQGSDYGFIFVDQAGKVLKDWSQLFGTRACWNDAACFLTSIERDGWGSIPAGLLPRALVASVGQVGFILSLANTGLPTILLVPAGVLDLNLIRLEVKG